MAADDRRALLPTGAEIGLFWFCRLVALYCLATGISYWLRLVGFYEGSLYRFDLMPTYWQAPAICLAVLYPFAASGLWMVSSWGPVIWFLCLATEGVMYGGFPELYGSKPVLLVGYAIAALAYIGLRGAIYLQKRSRV